MMRSNSRARNICDEGHAVETKLSRRKFVVAGSCGFGLSLSQILQADASAKEDKPLPSAIILWMRGGPSQHETWDPKPNAPEEYRGTFGATGTNVPGIQICDLLPRSASIMSQWSIVRSLFHGNAGHSAADQICFTGYPAPRTTAPNGPGNEFPSCGAVVTKQLQHQRPELPAYVMVPRMVPGTGSGYLGASFRPFETIADPAGTGPFRVPNLELSGGLDVNRVGDRKSLLSDLDGIRRRMDSSGEMEALDHFQHRAWDMLTGENARKAFDLDAEPQSIRDRYGFMRPYIAPTPDRCGVPAWSQRFLLARRLIENGVRIVTVDCRWWDTHVKGYETMRDGFLPRWDQAYSALLTDLAERGLLDSTMVLAWGEFGRTPRVNATGGRDHYPNVFSAALAGGPIQGGRAIGASDSKGAFPAESPKTPQDVLATLYQHMRVDRNVAYEDNNGRPHPVLSGGEVIRELL